MRKVKKSEETFRAAACGGHGACHGCADICGR